MWFKASCGAVYSMPARWTSIHVADGFELASAGRSRFRSDDLVKLVELLESIKNGSEIDEKGVDDV